MMNVLSVSEVMKLLDRDHVRWYLVHKDARDQNHVIRHRVRYSISASHRPFALHTFEAPPHHYYYDASGARSSDDVAL